MKGYQYTLGYVITASLSNVLIQSINGLSMNLVLFLTTLIAIIFFNASNLHLLVKIYRGCWRQWRLFLAVNSTVFIMWWLTYWGIKSVGASLFIYLFFTTLVFIAAVYAKQRKRVLITCVFIIAGLIWGGQGFTVIYGILGGISGYYYNRYSHAFAKKAELSASQVLASRFYLMLIMLAFITPFKQIVSIQIHMALNIGLISLCSFILPLYLSQKGLNRIGTTAHSFLLSFTPLCTFLFEWLILKQALPLLLLLSALLPVALYSEGKHIKKWIRFR